LHVIRQDGDVDQILAELADYEEEEEEPAEAAC